MLLVDKNIPQPLAELQTTIQDSVKLKADGGVNSFSEKYESDLAKSRQVFGGQAPVQKAEKLSFEDKISADNGYALVGDEYIRKYPTFKLGRDNNEFAAQNQSTWEKSFNGVTKAINNLGGVVVGNTLGLVYGIEEGVRQGSFNAVFDNSFTRTLDDWNTKLDYKFANYVTEDNKNKGFFGSLTDDTANFLANDVLNGVSFTFGTIVSEAIWAYATGGTSLATTWARNAAKLANTGRLIRGVETVGRVAEEVVTASKWGERLLGSSDEVAKGVAKWKDYLNKPILNSYEKVGEKIATGSTIRAAKLGEGLTTARFVATTSGNEAGIEAFHFKKEARENFDYNFERQHGREATAEERAEFEDNIGNAANAVFASNMAILSVSNLAFFGGMFGIKTPFSSLEKSINKSLFGIGTREVEKGVFKGIEATTKQKIGGFAYHLLKPTFTEGVFEEGLQGVTTKVATKWADSTYNPKYHDQTLSVASAAYESMIEQYTSKQGLKEIGIGGLIGLIGVGGAVRRTNQAREFQKDYVAKGMNAFGEKSLFAQKAFTQKILTDAKVQGAVQRKAEAVEKRDTVGALLADNDLLVSQLQHREYMKEDLDVLNDHARAAMNSVTEEMWNEAGIKEDDRQAHIDGVLDGYKSLISSFKEASSFADALVGSGKIRGTEHKTQVIRDSLTHAIVSGEKSHLLMQEALQDISKYVGEDNRRTMELVTSLNQMDKELQTEVDSLNLEHSDISEKEKEVEKELAKVQATPTETNVEKGTALQKLAALRVSLQERKIEIEKRQDDIASNITQLSERQIGVENVGSSIDFNKSSFTGRDIREVEKRIEDIDNIINSYEGRNKIDHQNLLSSMRQFESARNNFYNYQGVVDIISKGEFKIKNKDGFLFKIFDGKYKMDDFVTEFLNDISSRHLNDTMALGEQQEAVEKRAELEKLNAKEEKTEEDITRIAEIQARLLELENKEKTKEDKKAELEKELESIEDENSERALEINKELSEIERELTPDDTPDTSEENLIKSQIEALEKEKAERLAEIDDQVGNLTNDKLKIIYDKLDKKRAELEKNNKGLTSQELDSLTLSTLSEEEKQLLRDGYNNSINNKPISLLNRLQELPIRDGSQEDYDKAINIINNIDFNDEQSIQNGISELANSVSGKNIANTTQTAENYVRGKEKLIGNDNYKTKEYLESYINILYKDFTNQTEFFKKTTTDSKANNSITLFHGTANVLEGEFNTSRSNTSDTIFLTDSESFANEFAFNDEFRPDGVTYTVTANLEKTFDSNTDEAIKELEPLIRELVAENYTYKTGLNYRTDLKQINIGGRVIENPTQEDFVQHYLWRAKSNWRLMESPRVIEFLKSKGYDSFTIKERGANNIAVFDKSKIVFEKYKNKKGEERIVNRGETTTQSDIEAKKADIERRRNEELEASGDNYLLPFILDDPNFERRENSKLLKRKQTQDKINAKYDAELKALEEQPAAQPTDNIAEKEKIEKEYDRKIKNLKDKLTPTENKTVLEQLKDKVDEIVKNLRTGFISKDIDEMAKSRPDQKDMDRYDELLRSVTMKSYKEVLAKALPSGIDDFEKKNKAVLDEYNALYEKLSNWRIYGSLTNGQDSIVDLLDHIYQMEQEVGEQETLDVDEKALSFLGEEEVGDISIKDLGNNTNFTPTTKLIKGDVRITHVKPATITESFENAEVIVKQQGKKKLINPSKEVLNNLESAEIIIKEGVNEYLIRLTPDGRLYMKADVFQSLKDILNMYSTVEVTKDYVNWSYHHIMKYNGSTLVPMPSDFKNDKLTGDTFSLKEGDVVELYVDVEDEYSQKIHKEKDRNRLVSKVRIYIRKNGVNYNDLKALNEGDVNEDFLKLREKAADQFITGKSGVVGTTTITYVPLGLPMMTMNSQNRIEPIEITEDATKAVITTGYILNGELVLANKALTEKVRKSFVKKQSENNRDKKVPIVVFKRGEHLIAFPITMTKTKNSKKETFDLIMGSDATSAQKIKEINDLLLENGITPKEYSLVEWNETILTTIQTRLSNLEDSVSADELAKPEYDKLSLTKDAKIAIDLADLNQVMPSQKLNYDLKNIEYSQKSDEQVDSKTKNISTVTPKTKKAEKVTEKDVEEAKKTGVVSDNVVNTVAEKIVNAEPLTKEETEIADIAEEKIKKVTRKKTAKKEAVEFKPKEKTFKTYNGVNYYFVKGVWNTKGEDGMKAVDSKLNKELIKNSQRKQITDEEYNDFIDTGKVSKEVIDGVASKIKNGQELDSRDVAVYSGKGKDIEGRLKDPEFQALEFKEPTYDDVSEEQEVEVDNSDDIKKFAEKLIKLNFNNKSDIGVLTEDEITFLEDNLGKINKVKANLEIEIRKQSLKNTPTVAKKATLRPNITEDDILSEYKKVFNDSKEMQNEAISQVKAVIKRNNNASDYGKIVIDRISTPITTPTENNIENEIPPNGAIFYNTDGSLLNISRFFDGRWYMFTGGYFTSPASKNREKEMTKEYFTQIEKNKVEKNLNCE